MTKKIMSLKEKLEQQKKTREDYVSQLNETI